jgi:hypothetical protein
MKRSFLVALCAIAIGFVFGVTDFARPAGAQIIIDPGDPGGPGDPGVITCPNGRKPSCVRCTGFGGCVRACYGGTYCDCPRTPHPCGF